VTVIDELDERYPPTVEATAYFVVSEALTNVAKYAEATMASVVIGLDGDRLVIEIADDGRGGADPTAGSGLHGLGDRIAALDGTLEVDSPPGQGTTVRASLNLAERREEERGVVLDERAAAILRLRRRRGFVTHAAVFGVFQIAMIAIWALTGRGEFWPGWTILLWGAVLALHGSLAILRQPITDSAVFRATARPPGG
jgi:hypothetical protein